jgi:hypothetical protein
MSRVIDNDGNIPDPALYFKCREDDEWMYHYERFIKFKWLKDTFDQMCFEEYERLSLREEELGVKNDR